MMYWSANPWDFDPLGSGCSFFMGVRVDLIEEPDFVAFRVIGVAFFSHFALKLGSFSAFASAAYCFSNGVIVLSTVGGGFFTRTSSYYEPRSRNLPNRTRRRCDSKES